MSEGWGNDACPAVDRQGKPCVLPAGHGGNHKTAAQSRERTPLTDNQRAALVVMAVVALAAVVLVYVYINNMLGSML